MNDFYHVCYPKSSDPADKLCKHEICKIPSFFNCPSLCYYKHFYWHLYLHCVHCNWLSTKQQKLAQSLHSHSLSKGEVIISFIRPLCQQWMNPGHRTSALHDLPFTSQITPVPNYTPQWQKHACAQTNCSGLWRTVESATIRSVTNCVTERPSCHTRLS